MKKTKIGMSVNVYWRMVREKVTTVVLALSVVMAATCLIGCGNKSNLQVDGAAEQYKDELGMSDEDAQALAEALYGSEEEQYGNDNEKGYLFDVLPEIQTAKVSDPIVQVCGAIIKTDCTMTAKEALNEISTKSKMQFHYEQDFKPLTDDAIISDKMMYVDLVDDKNNRIAWVGVYNSLGEYTAFNDGVIFCIVPYCEISGTGFNIIKGGNFCEMLAYDNANQATGYDERLAQFPLLSFLDFKEYAKEQGFKYVTVDNTGKINAYITHQIPNEDNYIVEFYKMFLDDTTGKIKDLSISGSIQSGEESFTKLLFKEAVTDEFLNELVAKAKESFSNSTEYANKEVKLVGVLANFSTDGGDAFYANNNAIFKLGDEYALSSIDAHINYNGKAIIDKVYFPNIVGSYEECTKDIGNKEDYLVYTLE